MLASIYQFWRISVFTWLFFFKKGSHHHQMMIREKSSISDTLLCSIINVSQDLKLFSTSYLPFILV